MDREEGKVNFCEEGYNSRKEVFEERKKINIPVRQLFKRKQKMDSSGVYLLISI